jgi:proline iminopeptidase
MDVAPIIAYDLHRSIVASRLEVFEESGHLPFFEEPARFVSVVEGFLTDRA